MDLTNKIVLVTWASSGIWQAIAIAFAKKWAKIIIHFNNNKQWAENTKKYIEEFWWVASIYNADIGIMEEINILFENLKKDFGTIDILVNNAWTLWPYWEFASTSIKDITELLQTNLIGTLYCTQQAIHIFQSQNKHWVIINNTSVHANWDKWWEDLALAYCISKAGLENFTKLLARQVSPYIRVNAIAPWVTLTPIRNEDTQETKDYMISKSLIKRWITPEEIANGCVFIAENEAMNWSTLEIDWWFRA